MERRFQVLARSGVLSALIAALLGGCGPSAAYRAGESAEQTGDWYNAVVAYRAELADDPDDEDQEEDDGPRHRHEANLKLSKKDSYYSDFEPMVEYMQEDGKPDTWASAITINVPWLWPKNRSKVKESKEDLSAAKSDYRFISNKTLFEVKDFLVKVQSSESTINLYKTGVIPQAEQSLKAARIGYEAAQVDFLTLIDSQRILLNSRLLYIRALADFEQNLANLEKAVGTQLTQ